MNVYEAIEASPIRVARHDKGRVLTESDPSIIWCARNMRSGWQPLYTSPAEYTPGEPLTKLVKDQAYIRIKKETGEVQSGRFTGGNFALDPTSLWTYYADPRPLPTLPEPKKEEPKLFTSGLNGRHYLTAEGAARLEKLLKESEGE